MISEDLGEALISQVLPLHSNVLTFITI